MWSLKTLRCRGRAHAAPPQVCRLGDEFVVVPCTHPTQEEGQGVGQGYSSLWCTGFSLRWLLLLRSTGSRRAGFSSCGMRAQ